MTSRHLVDPELLPAMEAIPSFSVDADTLDEIRRAVAEARVPAPSAPTTVAEELFIPGPGGTSLRVVAHVPKSMALDTTLMFRAWQRIGVVPKPGAADALAFMLGRPLRTYCEFAAGCAAEWRN